MSRRFHRQPPQRWRRLALTAACAALQVAQAAPTSSADANNAAPASTPRAVLREVNRLAASLWTTFHEVADDLNPLARSAAPLRSVPAPAGASRSGEARALRIGELPTLLGVAPTLPLDDKQKGTAARAINLQLAMSLGVAHSLEVQAAAARLESFEQAAVAARGALLPHLDGRAAVGSGTLDSVSPSETRHRKEGSLTARQPLFDVPAAREMHRQSLLAKSSEIQYQAAVSNANLQVATAYLQALQARLTLELSGEYERVLGELLAQVTARAEAGGTSNAERDRVRARVANARAQMADSRANLRATLRALETLIGETPADLAIGAPPLLEVPATAEDALGEARLANRDLEAARTEAAATAMEAGSQRARFLPRVEAELSHNRTTNAGGTASYTRDTKGMLVMTWSLLNGGSDLAQSRSVTARMREKQLRADDLVRTLDQDLSAAYASLDAVSDRYAALRDELAANRTVVTAFKAQLVGGNRPLLDVLDAYQRLHQSRVDLAQLVVSEVQNHLKVAHLTGRLSNLGDRP